MTNLISLKSDCNKALELCIEDCQKVVQAHKDVTGMEKCIELCLLCIRACSDCLDACESAQLDRGKLMHGCAEACKRCAAECGKHGTEDCAKCAASCNNCIEEFKHLLA